MTQGPAGASHQSHSEMAPASVITRVRDSKWLLVALLWGVAVLNYLDRQVIFSQFPLIEQDLQASPTQLGLISSVFLWVYGALSPFAGYIADRWGRARVILLSLLVWSFATWITAHVTSIETMLASRVLMGISEAFYLPAALSLIADRHGPGTRSLATGIHQSGLYTGIVLGGVWGGWMGQNYGWRPTFTILGAIGIAYVLLLALGLRRDRPRAVTTHIAGSISEVVRAPGFTALAIAFGAISIANWLIYTWLPLFLTERFHLSLTEAGFTATFYIQIASYIGMVAIGAFTDRLAVRNPSARVWVQMAGMSLTAPLILILSSINSYAFLVPVLILIGLLRPWFDVNAMPVLRQIAPAKLSATGYGLLNMVGCISGGVGAAFAGALKQSWGLSAAYQVSAIILIAGAIVLARLLRAPGVERAEVRF